MNVENHFDISFFILETSSNILSQSHKGQGWQKYLYNHQCAFPLIMKMKIIRETLNINY